MKRSKRTLAALTALLLLLTAFPLHALAGYDTATAHVNAKLEPVFTYTGEYAQFNQIAVGDPFDLMLRWSASYGGGAADSVGQIEEITLVQAGNIDVFYVLYKDGAAYYGAKAAVNGSDATLTGVSSAEIQPGSYFVYVTARDSIGVNTVRSTALQAFSSKSPEEPEPGMELGFPVEPVFFCDDGTGGPASEIPIGETFDLSVYMDGHQDEVLLIELFSDGDPIRAYTLYENGQVFYGGKIDNEEEGPEYMTGFSSAEFEPGDYYLKIATVNGADGTHEPAITFTGESSQMEGPGTSVRTLPEAKEGETYSYTLKATPKYGGAITWSLASSSLPKGLTLNAKTGVISGTPANAGTYTFTVKAEEVGGGSRTVSLTLNVKAPPAYSVSFLLKGGKAAAGADYGPRLIKEGGTVELPAAPTKGGYRFVYWQRGGDFFLPGETVEIRQNASFSAVYAVREPLKVGLPERIRQQAVGQLQLIGYTADGRTSYLWSAYHTGPDAPDVKIPAPSLKNTTYTKLELYGKIDRAFVLLATYGGEVSDETEAVTLTDAGAAWETVRGIKVKELAEGADYRVLQVTSDFGVGEEPRVWFPMMITPGRVFKLRLYPEAASAAALHYDLSGDYTASKPTEGYLEITPLPLNNSAAVTVSVEVNGEPFEGTVIASQTVNGVIRTVSGRVYQGAYDTAYASTRKPFTLRLIPGVETTFSLSYGGRETFLFEGEILASPKNGGSHAIKARTVTLYTRLSVQADADPALVQRYVKTIGSVSRTEIEVRQKNAKYNAHRTVFLRNELSPALTVSRALELGSIKPDAACSVTITSGVLADRTAETQVKGGVGEAEIDVKLKPGVVVSLRSYTTGSYYLAWFDSAGKYIGRSESVHISSAAADVASVCPTGKAGSYTVALAPGYYQSDVYFEGKTLGELPEGQIVTSWPVTLTETGVRELDAFTADGATSENAVFVTRPHSTMTANVQSFSSPSELLMISGSVTLDSWLGNGNLKTLQLTAENSDSFYLSEAVIGGARYSLSAWSNRANGSNYSITLPEPIELPCHYTIYGTPAHADRDVILRLTAGVTYGENGRASDQLIGSVSVSRPGAYISTFSEYVCRDTVTVSGVGVPGETLKIYDNDVPVLEGKLGNTQTEWTAAVQLDGTDGNYATLHELHAETGSGVVSNTIAIVHRANGPELKSLDMGTKSADGTVSWNSGAFYTSGFIVYADDVLFRPVFENPDELEDLPGWDCKAVVKVYLENGTVLTAAAEKQKDGSFVAHMGPFSGACVELAEVKYLPKAGDTRLKENKDGSYTLTADAQQILEVKTTADYIRASLTTGKDGKIAFVDRTAADSWGADFADGKVTITGADENGEVDRLSAKDVQANYERAAAELEKEGLTEKSLSVRYGDSSVNLMQWLNDAGERKAAANKKADENAVESTFTRTVVFADKDSFENAKKTAANYAVNAAYSEYAAGSNHLHTDYGAGRTADIYTLSDLTFDADLYPSATYYVLLNFFADTTAKPAVYTCTATAELSADFTGFKGLKTVKSAKQNVASLLVPVVWAEDAGSIISYFGGDFNEADNYAFYNEAETGTGWLANITGGSGGLIGSMHPDFRNQVMTDMGNVLSAGGIGLSAWNMHLNIKNHDYRVHTSLEMRQDLRWLLESACFKRLPESQKELCREAFKKFEKAYKKAQNTDFWVGCASGSADAVSMFFSALSFGASAAPAQAINKLGTKFTAAVTAVNTVGGVTGFDPIGKTRQEMIKQYKETYRTIKSIFSAHAKRHNLDDCTEYTPESHRGIQGAANRKRYVAVDKYFFTYDPCGVVYEGVIENPVKDATVTLWYATDADGNLVTEKNTKTVKQIVPASDVTNKTPIETVQITGENGKYQWFVPQGLWYVTAEKAGLTGSSNKDKAATVKVSGVKADGKAVSNLLPVLPVQLDVNIPIVDKTAPAVESVRVTDEGVYVTFSKYMVDTAKGADSVLNAANYTLKTASGKLTVAAVKPVEQGHTPANIDGTQTKTYTRTVLVTTKETLKAGTELLLTVKKAVKSYAGSAMAADHAESGKVEAQKALGAPTIAGGGKQTVPYGAAVAIALPKGAPDGTKIYYTTDGSAPTKDAKLYEHPFSATNKTTVKAIAVCPGHKDSAVTSAEFVIKEAQAFCPAGDVLVGGQPAPAGLTLTLSGGGFKATAKTASDGSYVFYDVPVGSYTLSFAGNAELNPASVPVEITAFDPWVDLTLTDKNTTPAYTPGDVDANSEINAADARLALRRAVELETYPEGSAAFLACDVDKTGTVTAADARLILRAAVGLEDPKTWK